MFFFCTYWNLCMKAETSVLIQVTFAFTKASKSTGNSMETSTHVLSCTLNVFCRGSLPELSALGVKASFLWSSISAFEYFLWDEPSEKAQIRWNVTVWFTPHMSCCSQQTLTSTSSVRCVDHMLKSWPSVSALSAVQVQFGDSLNPEKTQLSTINSELVCSFGFTKLVSLHRLLLKRSDRLKLSGVTASVSTKAMAASVWLWISTLSDGGTKSAPCGSPKLEQNYT